MLTEQTKQSIRDIYFASCPIDDIEMSEEEYSYYKSIVEKYDF